MFYLYFYSQKYNFFSYLCAHEMYFHIIYDIMVRGRWCHAQTRSACRMAYHHNGT